MCVIGPSGGHPSFIQGSSGVDPKLIRGMPKVAWDDFKAIRVAVTMENGRKNQKNELFVFFFVHPQTSFNHSQVDFRTENSFFLLPGA